MSPAAGNVVRAEFRKVFSTRLWWGLLAPVVLLAALVDAFGGLFTAALERDLPGAPSLLPASLAYAMSLTALFAGLHGIVAGAGEFRHRTITTTYLTAAGRGSVQFAKSVAGTAVGGLYALATAVVGVPVGLVAHAATPPAGTLLAVVVLGIVVGAVWGVLGTAIGLLTGNQVAAVVGTLLYALLGELLLSVLLNRSGWPGLARLTSYLPVNAGDITLYDVPARALAGPDGPKVVEVLAGVTAPPPWWGALLVLVVWTGAFAAAAAVVAGRRDIT